MLIPVIPLYRVGYHKSSSVRSTPNLTATVAFILSNNDIDIFNIIIIRVTEFSLPEWKVWGPALTSRFLKKPGEQVGLRFRAKFFSRRIGVIHNVF